MLLGVRFAFTQADYFVSEGAGSASVCIALVSGTTVTANIPIELSTRPVTADGKSNVSRKVVTACVYTNDYTCSE